jgi:hypothetical protein
VDIYPEGSDGIVVIFSDSASSGAFTIEETATGVNGDPQCSGDPSNDSSGQNIQGSTSNADVFEVTYNGNCLWDFFIPYSAAADFVNANVSAETDTAGGHMPGVYGQPVVFSDVDAQSDGSNLPDEFRLFTPVTGCRASSDAGIGYTFAVWSRNYAGSCGA